MSRPDLPFAHRLSAFPDPLTFAVLALILACFAAPPARAAASLFGPETFVQQPGPVETFTHSFAAPLPGAGYVLWLHNGDADSSPNTRANLVEVWLNGELLVDRGNFLPVTQDLEVPVTLAAENELQVAVQGGKGRYVSLEVLALPVADAGPDQAARLGQRVTLDGSASFDLGGGPLSYAWELAGEPAGSAAVLSDAGAIRPSFTPDLPGDYLVRLTVSDGRFESAPDEVRVSTLNTPPRADAGPDQVLASGALAVLDGSGSADAEGDPLGFVWTLVEAPAGSLAALRHADTPHPEFDLDLAGDYRVELSVHDGQAASAPDWVLVTTDNAPPVAVAGPDQVVPLDEAAALDGSGSWDPNGDPLSYRWDLLAAPAGSAADLAGMDAPLAELVPDLPGDYAIQLQVDDGWVTGRPDTLVLSAVDHLRPVAVTGGPWAGAVGRLLALDGSGSYDPEGEPLGFHWTLDQAPAGSHA